jgi:hypothetical protein
MIHSIQIFILSRAGTYLSSSEIVKGTLLKFLFTNKKNNDRLTFFLNSFVYIQTPESWKLFLILLWHFLFHYDEFKSYIYNQISET